MNTLAQLLKNARQESGLKLREAAAIAQMDAALLSKYENGQRLPPEDQAPALAKAYHLDEASLRRSILAEKVAVLLQYETDVHELLMVAESRIEYLRSERSLVLPEIPGVLVDKLISIDALKTTWHACKPMNNSQLERMRQYFHTEYTFESNRIEGNTLTLQETSLVINEGLTISGKTMREHLEAVNHADAVAFITELATQQADLDRRTLLDLHNLILRGVDSENAGRYRSVPVRIGGSRHEPPQPYLLDKLMEDYFIHYRQQRDTLHPVLLAADMHERLVSIHPFIDGNGRTSRLVMNLILLRNGYTIANLKGDPNSRLAYYRALEKVQADNEPEHFYTLVADAVETSLQAHIELAG
ncbi:MAG TPA: Fic family protein [Saprospiraceae bacterium]|nr:Fic family protein [Saprospiraceae bacterium]